MRPGLFDEWTIRAGWYEGGDRRYFGQTFPTVKDAKRVANKFLRSCIGVNVFSGIAPEKINSTVFVEADDAFYCRTTVLDNGIPKPARWQTIKR